MISSSVSAQTSKINDLCFKGLYEACAEMAEEYIDNHKNREIHLLLLRALILQDKNEEAFEVSLDFIRSFHLKEHQAVLKYYASSRGKRKSKARRPRISKELTSLYLKITKLLTNVSLSYKNVDLLSHKKFKSQSLFYRRLYLMMGGSRSESNTIIEPLVKEFTVRKKYNKKFNYFLTLGYEFWQDQLFVNQSGAPKAIILVDVNAYKFGFGIQKEYESWLGNLELSYSRGLSTLTAEDSSILSYQQRNITTEAIRLTPGIFFKSKSLHSTWGLSLPLVYRSGNYEEASGMEITNKKDTQFWYSLGYKFRKENWGVSSDYSLYNDLGSSLFGIYLNYYFTGI